MEEQRTTDHMEQGTAPSCQASPQETPVSWYHNVSLEDAEIYIKANLQSAVRSVIAVGYYLKCIRDGELYLAEGYQTIWEYAMDRFGFSVSTASRYMARNDRFSKNGNSPILDEKYRKFSKSQLQEMLSLTDDQLEMITPDMTVRQIREMKKAPKEIPYYEIPGQIEMVLTSEELGMDTGMAISAEDTAFLLAEGEMPGQSQDFILQTADLLPDDGPEEERGEETIWEMPIATSQQIIEPEQDYVPEAELTDLELLQKMVEKENKNLSEMIKVEKAEPHPELKQIIRKKKLLVTSLASMLCDLDVPTNAQPELPAMKNNDQRKAWLRNYKDWGLWYEDEHIGVRYYKYDFDHGARLIVEELSEDGRIYESAFYHLVGGPKPPAHPKYGYGKWSRHETYCHHPDSETELIEFLKEVQR